MLPLLRLLPPSPITLPDPCSPSFSFYRLKLSEEEGESVVARPSELLPPLLSSLLPFPPFPFPPYFLYKKVGQTASGLVGERAKEASLQAAFLAVMPGSLSLTLSLSLLSILRSGIFMAEKEVHLPLILPKDQPPGGWGMRDSSSTVISNRGLILHASYCYCTTTDHGVSYTGLRSSLTF